MRQWRGCADSGRSPDERNRRGRPIAIIRRRFEDLLQRRPHQRPQKSSSAARRALTWIVPDLPCLLVTVCILAKGYGDCASPAYHDHRPHRLLQNLPDTTSGGRVRTRLCGGGRWIRTLGPPSEGQRLSRLLFPSMRATAAFQNARRPAQQLLLPVVDPVRMNSCGSTIPTSCFRLGPARDKPVANRRRPNLVNCWC
jgi:hypothetical protein